MNKKINNNNNFFNSFAFRGVQKTCQTNKTLFNFSFELRAVDMDP